MPWQTLDIAPTADEREIRRAYARQLKSRQHEEDAEFFSRLRWAYETALVLARAREDVSEDETPSEFFRPFVREEAKETSENPPEIFSQIPLIPESLPESPGDEILDISSSPKETLEDLLRDLEGLLEKPASDQISEKYRRSRILCKKWENIRTHPQLESLAEREIFSERLAVLLAKHWPKSDALWSKLRDFFAWRPPVFSDNSTLGLALRFLFDSTDNEETSNPVPVRKTWKERWRGFMDSICYPCTLLILLLRISKAVFDEKHVPEPAASSWQAIKNFLSGVEQTTKFAIRISFGIYFFILFLSPFLTKSFKIIYALDSIFAVFIVYCMYALHVKWFPSIHDTKIFDLLLFQYHAYISRFFVIYFWTMILFISVLAVYRVFQ
jgi:hypothetical protein